MVVQRPLPGAGYVALSDGEEWQDEVSSHRVRANFWWMSACFAVNHGCVTTPLVVSTTVLDAEVASLGNGILYATTVFASLFVAAPMTHMMGAKASMLCGMFLYCMYAGGFALALIFQDIVTVAWLAFGVGSVCGGLAAGAMWTAQGSYFSTSATMLSKADGRPRAQATASLAGLFAFAFLTCEVGSKLGYSALQSLEVEVWLIGLINAMLGLFAWVAMFWVENISMDSLPTTIFSKVWAVASLWSDPNIWLLSPMNFSFGFAAAFMNGYVNSTYARSELGPESIGALAALTAATAAVLSRPFGALSTACGKGLLVALGASCLLGVPLCIFVLGCCEGWRWRIGILYILQGMGRSVYESTNRAIFSDFFPGENSEGAFANCMLQSSLSFAMCFFLQASLTGCTLASIVLVFAAITPICYALARLVRRKRAQPQKESLRAVRKEWSQNSPEMGA